MNQERFFRKEALASIFSDLDDNFEKRKKLGQEIWALGFELLSSAGKKTEVLRQKKGEMVASVLRKLSLEVEGFIIETPFFSCSERPKIYFGRPGKSAVIVIPYKGVPWIASQEIGEISSKGEMPLRFYASNDKLTVLLGFLKEVGSANNSKLS